jgi:phage-related protein
MWLQGERRGVTCSVAKYTVAFHETASGRAPVLEFLENLRRTSRKAWTKCTNYIALLEDQGWGLATKHQYAEKVEDRIWTLRPEFGGVEYRLFYTWDAKAKEYVIFDVIAKKTQELTERDKRRVRNRLKEVLHG